MAIDVQSLMSQLSTLTSETSLPRSPFDAEDSDSLRALNNEYSKNQEVKQVLQSLTQAIAESSTQEKEKSGDGVKSIVDGRTSIAGHKDSDERKWLSIPVSQMGIRTRTCPAECSCPCHTQTIFRTPQALREIAGRLFLGYSGRPMLQQDCASSCFHIKSKPMTLTYFFPSWFARQVVNLTLSYTSLNTPTFNIKVRKVVSEVSPLFAFSRNNAQAVQKLFEDRLASPDDVHAKGGWTPLHVSSHVLFKQGFSDTDFQVWY